MSYFQPQSITFEAALRDVASGSDKAREQAAAALGDVRAAGDRARAAEALIAALGDKVSRVRGAAARALGELGDSHALDPLIALLEDAAAPVRQVAAVAIGNLGLAAGFEPLADALLEGPAELRFQAARSLVEIDPERAFHPLAAALESEEDPEVLGQIGLALGEVGHGEIVDRLAARLGDLAGEPRFEVAYGLARLGDRRAAPILAAALGDRALSWDAIEGLELVGGDEAIAALATAQSDRRLAPELQLRAAAALLALGESDAETRDVLAGGLFAWRHHLRALAIQELARVGSEWAVPALERLRERRRGAAHLDDIEAAIAAIGQRSRDVD